MKKLLTIALTALVSTSAAAAEYVNELALVESWLASQRAYDNVPGLSAAIVHDQELAWSGGFGLADIAGERAAEADTIYGICSISKLFTGVAVMQLRDQGKFDLDDPLAELLPWFNLVQAHDGSPEITLRAVLTHSAGLPRESDYPYWMGPDFDFPSSEKIRERLGQQATLYPADRYFQYSNLGLSLAGDVVEEQSGQDFDGYIRKNVLQPLGMADTDTGFPADAREPRVATGYSYPGREQTLKAMPRYDARGITPAAGFASTALDLGKFASWQFRLLAGEDDGVLKANTLREMQRVQWLDWDWGTARGLAFGVYRVGDRTLTGHAGDCPGFNTRLFLDPLGKVAVAMMANRNRVDVDGYAAAIFDIVDGGGTVDDEPQAENLDDYTGSYDLNPWDGEEMVFRWKDGLAVISVPTMSPMDSLTLLKHVAGDRFHTVRDDDGEPGHEVRFVRGDGGEVTHMRVHSMALPRLAD
ncbi:MAG: serine hydrolase [Xanthomonadales bacterium]|jgi:CubicO group peptidase (beta-lactamase class C family)|nr:serine hydrolase [Xanthomonadales bacterium]